MKQYDKSLSAASIKQRINEYNRVYFKQSAKKAKNSKSHWTKVEDQLVIRHEQPDRELAHVIGRSQKAIEARRHKLRLQDASVPRFVQTHQYTDDELDLICNSGKSLKEISKTLGLSISAIANMRYKYRNR